MSPIKPYTILSPAKINLILNILGQREDGYHRLQTYFQLLNWGDTMDFKILDEDKVILRGDFKNVDLQNNLIYRALEILKPYRKLKTGVDIRVEKRIPQGSGLGGGSSNAASTLVFMNKLWNCNLDIQKLQELGLSLGADVPLFVLNKSSMAEGVGEKLTPFKIKPHYFVLIFPNVSISTVKIFQDENLKRNDKKIKDFELINNKANWTNSCLNVVLRNFPQVKSIYMQASKLAPTFMSGTGSTLFCAFDSRKEAELFCNKCPQEWKLQLCSPK
jgi:4-diphosphocytidyl-2-C-methyl-D-erythritol kinase